MPTTNSAVADPIPLAQHAPEGGQESASRSTRVQPAYSGFPSASSSSQQKGVYHASERQDEHSARARLKSPGQDSTTALLAPKPKAQQGKKKTNSGVLGFLTLKEPSMSAWEAYAEAERKKALQKGGNSTVKDTRALRKLPDEVSNHRNKRHSLPESAKLKSKEPKSAQSGKSDSTATTERKKPSHIPLSSIPKYSEEMSKHIKPTAAQKVQPEVKSNATSSRAKTSLFADQRYSLRASSVALPPALTSLTEHESDEVEEEEEEEDYDTTMDLDLRQQRKSPPKLSSLSPAEALEILDMVHMEDLDEASSGTISPLMSPLTPPGVEGDIDPILLRVHSPTLDTPEATAAAHSSDESKNNASVRPLHSRAINFSRPRISQPTSPT